MKMQSTTNNSRLMSKAELVGAIARLRTEITFGGENFAKTRRLKKLEKALSTLVARSVPARVVSGGAPGLKK